MPPKLKESNLAEEELNLGASASPTTPHPPSQGEYPTYHIPAPTSLSNKDTRQRENQQYWHNPQIQSQQETYNSEDIVKHDTGYVGLVNQAMTCYLNSLLQALFMTPEFRNALYNWQYDSNTNSMADKCIPYKLQRLFVNLQTSHKSAVETTELTRSFGWDSSEAWQQHDIQELCRVMFDALEQEFKDTKQGDLIDRLYQGKMIDYVKCLECGQEKSREDTFLDIPLPVRPFGSTVAYGSVVEALRAFVQPETLEGANQYLCEACAKKCDAHKGLKFTKFPYILTLHLKRFDFDYNTMHRIKLNDKVTFPERLDLNSFVEQEGMSVGEEGSEGIPDELTVSKCDDSSTTDSGSALDDETTTDLPQHHDINQDDDEGIDVSGGNGSNHHENEKNRRHGLSKGPYLYDLFSIMIHSGSASGGHYYAYIKDFANGEWFCFNDTSVTRITSEDIQKTFGGGALRGYYSGAYSSSTNAYMLMYRQISEDNCNVIKVEDFPEHIKKLHKDLQEKHETDRRLKERHSELSIIKWKVYCQHPTKGMYDANIFFHNDMTLEEATTKAFDAFKLGGLVEQSDCRLVSYNPSQESIEASFEGREKDNFTELLSNFKREDLLLEIKKKDEEFEVYQPGGVTIKVYFVDLEKEEVDTHPVSIRSALTNTVSQLKDSIGMIYREGNIDPKTMVLAVPCCTTTFHSNTSNSSKYFSSSNLDLLDDDNETVSKAWGMGNYYSPKKVYVCNGPLDKPFHESKIHEIIDRFEHVITLHLALPDTDPDTLARMSIPPLSSCQAKAVNKEAEGSAASITPPQDKAVADAGVKGARGLMLPLNLTGVGEEESGGGSSAAGHSDQSTSEDSSLTDSDRTLIGDVPDECLSEGDNQLNSPPGEDPNPLPTPATEEENWDEPAETPKQYNYFKATPYEQDSKKMLRIQVDTRMSIDDVKLCLEPYLGVPMSCFKLYRSPGSSEYTRPCDSLSGLKTEDTLVIKLGRQLTSDEHKIKVHQLSLSGPKPTTKYVCEWIVAKGGTVGQTKREIVDDLNKRNNLNLQYDKCRLRKKNWKNVGRVYLDSQTWVDDVTVYANGDIFLQELDEPETVTSTSQLSLFVRLWHPSTLTLDPFEELILDGFSIEDFKEKLSARSGIPVEFIDFAKPQGFFPCDMSVLSIHTELEWNPKAPSLESWPIQITEDGGVIFYRDSREELKTLTQEERGELTSKESARLSASSSSLTVSTYSPRKERPLKIYMDRRPLQTTDTDVD